MPHLPGSPVLQRDSSHAQVLDYHLSMLLDTARMDSYQRAIKASVKHGDVVVDTDKSREAYLDWLSKTRPGPGPNGLRRPLWYARPLKPAPSAYLIPPGV